MTEEEKKLIVEEVVTSLRENSKQVKDRPKETNLDNMSSLLGLDTQGAMKQVPKDKFGTKADLTIVSDNLTNEIQRATAAEKALSDGLTAEAQRAASQEASLQQSITEEITRAKLAEKANSTAIANEATRATAAEAELLKRVQGTSANSNPRTDPFKYIHLGQTEDNMATLKNKVDELANIDSVGFYRIVANNQSVVELHVIQMTSNLKGVMQVIKGSLNIYDTGNFGISTSNYIIAHRYCLPESISAWRISNQTAIEEYLKGVKDIEPKEYPFKSLGTYSSIDSLVAKLDTLAIITTDSPNTKLVGSFRAIIHQNIYTIYNDCASWNGVFIQTIMGCLTIGDEGKLASSNSTWGIYRRTSSNNNGEIKWGNWIPVADSNKLGNIEKNTSAISAEAARATAAEKALSERIDNIPTGGGVTREEFELLQQSTSSDSQAIATLNTTIINYNRRYSIAGAVTKQEVIEGLLNKYTADKGTIVTYYAEDGWHTIQYKLNYYNPTQGVKESNWVELGGDTPIIQQTETVVEISPNVLNIWGEVATLDITLGEPKVGVVNEYMFQFTSGATATTLVLPADINWVSAPNVQANKTYQVSIINNLGVIGEFSHE